MKKEITTNLVLILHLEEESFLFLLALLTPAGLLPLQDGLGFLLGFLLWPAK